MSIGTKLKQFLPNTISSAIENKYNASKDQKELNAVAQIQCDINNLRHVNNISIEHLFNSQEIENMWLDSKKFIDHYSIPDGSGGVNPGDRKALYYLISKFKPSSVLEVGTHIGSSTLHISSALHMSQRKNGSNPSLTTVDILDVNSLETKPWLKYGTKYSPSEMMDQLDYQSFVKFISDNSIHFASNCKEKYDFIFLDGSHAASVVYQEIPMALNLLNPNGIILLHDFFPRMKPLWSDGSIIPGPVLAVERFIKEGVNFTVLPIGALPWPTKLESNVTSLALLLRN